MKEEEKDILCPECHWIGLKSEADVHLYAHANFATTVVFCPLCGVRLDSKTTQIGITPKSKRL